MTARESTARAWNKIRSSPNLCIATVRYSSLRELRFEISYNFRRQKLPQSLMAEMAEYPWPKFHAEILATKVIAEIYALPHWSRTAIRLVRKGYPRDDQQGGCYELAEWYFRVAYTPVAFYWGNFEGDGPETQVPHSELLEKCPDSCFTRNPTPDDLLDLVGESKNVVVCVPAGSVDVRTFRWRGEEVRVGHARKVVARI